jgi:hypothetical protein
LLNVDFTPRDVTQIEIGDFHFNPGQHAAIHTHAAPAIGYEYEGTIYYQAEGNRVHCRTPAPYRYPRCKVVIDKGAVVLG